MVSRWLVILLTILWGRADSDSDLTDLSLLPLDRLLALKLALGTGPEQSASSDAPSSDVLGALPLRGDPGKLRHSPPRRGGGPGPSVWVDEVDLSWKGGGHGGKAKAGLQTIFQGTVTVLAFLAFGGYLVCLVLHALKEKKAALAMTLLNAEELRVRSARSVGGTGTPGDAMYLTLTRLAEGYTKYGNQCVKNSTECSKDFARLSKEPDF